MKKMNKCLVYHLLLFLLLIIVSNNVKSQVKSEGRDFWFTYMDNYYESDSLQRFQMSISANSLTSGTINIPALNWKKNFTIKADTTIIITLPMLSNWDALPENLKYEVVHVESNNTINITSLYYYPYSCDGTSILPVNSLSNSYYVMTYLAVENSYSEFSIVAINDNTKVRIIPANDTYDGHSKGVPYDTILNTGQAYQVLSTEDLTGTYISTNDSKKTFALFAGNNLTCVTSSDLPSNHLYEQMQPLNAWGTEYITVPFKSRLGSDVFRVMAANDGTIIYIDGVEYTTLNSGKFYEFQLQKASKITSNFPISLAQFSTSWSNDNVYADPTFIILSPTNKISHYINFNTFSFLDKSTIVDDDSLRYYINIITKTSAISNVLLDGYSIKKEFKTVSYDNKYSYAQIKISEGHHRLRTLHNSSIIATMYAYRYVDAYGFALFGNNIIDTLAPEINLSETSCFYTTYKITDNIIGDTIDNVQQYDTGIKSIELINSNNLAMELLTSPTIRTDTTYYEFLIKISVIEKLNSAYGIIKITDNAENIKYDTLNLLPYPIYTITTNPTTNNINIAVDKTTGKVKNVSFDISISNNQNNPFSLNQFNYMFTYKTNWFIFKGIKKSSDLDDSWTIQIDKNFTIGDSTYLYISGKGNNITDTNIVISELSFDVYYDNSVEYLPYSTNFKSNALNNDTCYILNYENELLTLLICGSDIMKFNFSATNYYLNVTPNPAQSNNIKIQYGIGLDSYLRIEIYNSYGELVKQIYNQEAKAGEYQNEINISDLSAGIYYIKIDSGPYLETKKLVIIK